MPDRHKHSFITTIAVVWLFACISSDAIANTFSSIQHSRSVVLEHHAAEVGLSGMDEAHDPWRLELTAWVWMVSVDGDLGALGRKADISASFRDVLRDSDSLFVFNGRMELGYERWGFFVDGMFAKLGTDDVPTAPGFPDVDVTYRQTLLDFGLMYRVAEWSPENVENDLRNATFDLYAGVRYTNLDLELDPTGLPRLRDRVDWFDPIIGAQLAYPFSRHWHVFVGGDVGGFGINSDYTWKATALLGYDFRFFDHRATLSLGYRAIGQDFSRGSGDRLFTWDVVQHGPLIGLSLSF
ncbi:MAG: hypothetical protein EA377_09560 [Phycisphaerales bacterium]|nr:MAG: hypothetical protein EA377_09560 [Phycisphaerales bacterium]